MPSSRQREQFGHRGYDTFYSTTNRFLACSEFGTNGLDHTLFDLATALPMCCFPNDDVHPSARYGEPENKRYRGRQNTHYGTRCFHDMASLASHIHDPYSGSHMASYQANHIDLFDLSPPFSASTVSSDWESNWSSKGRTTICGPAGEADPVPPSGGISYFALPTPSRNSLCNTGNFADDHDNMTRNQTELEWNDLNSFDTCSMMHGEDIQFLQDHTSWDPVAPGPSSGLSAGDSHEATTYQPTSYAPATVPATSILLPQHSVIPLSADRLTPEYTPRHIEKEVDDFLDGLADVINWEKADLDLGHTAINDMHTTNSPSPSDELAEQLHDDAHQNQSVEPDQQTRHPSPDTWDHELLACAAELPSAWDDFTLNEHHHFLCGPHSLEL